MVETKEAEYRKIKLEDEVGKLAAELRQLKKKYDTALTELGELTQALEEVKNGNDTTEAKTD